MTWQIILLVLAGAMLHAGWNVSVKSSTDKTLETGLIHLFCSIIAMPVALKPSRPALLFDGNFQIAVMIPH